MKKLFLSVAVLCVTLFVQAKDYADYVSPLVGTQSSFELSTGNTYPAISGGIENTGIFLGNTESFIQIHLHGCLKKQKQIVSASVGAVDLIIIRV